MNDSDILIRKLEPNLTTGEDVAVGLVLSDLASFHNRLHDIRALLGVEGYQELSEAPTAQELVDILRQFDRDDRDILEEWARNTATAYSLSQNWHIPFELVVLTNTLLVPFDESMTFNFFEPSDNLEDIVAQLGQQSGRASIQFSYKVNSYQITEYIRRHRAEFDRMMATLPEAPQTSQVPHTFLIGRLCYWLRNENGTTRTNWEQVAETMNRVIQGQHLSVTELDTQSARVYAERYAARRRRLEA